MNARDLGPLVTLVLSGTSCSLPPEPQEEPPPPPPCILLVVRVLPADTTLTQGDSLQTRANVMRGCTPAPGVWVWKYEVSDTTRLSIDQKGMIRGIGVGQAAVRATASHPDGTHVGNSVTSVEVTAR